MVNSSHREAAVHAPFDNLDTPAALKPGQSHDVTSGRNGFRRLYAVTCSLSAFQEMG
jgi:hypothetical protein